MLAGEAAQLDPEPILDVDQMTELSKEMTEGVIDTIIGTCGASLHFGIVTNWVGVQKALSLPASTDLLALIAQKAKRRHPREAFYLRDFQPS